MIAYRRNIEQLFQTFRRVLQPETLFIWTTALPVSQTVRGGVILDTIRFLSDVLRYDVLIANDFCSRVAADCGFDVVDLHFELRRHIDLIEVLDSNEVPWVASLHWTMVQRTPAHTTDNYSVCIYTVKQKAKQGKQRH